MTRRIAHVLPYPYVGGTEHGTLRIARAIDETRFTSVALCLGDAGPVRSLFEEAGIDCATYEPPVPSYRHGATFVSSSWSLARILKAQRADLVHCADIDAALYAGLAGRLAGIPVISHIRNRYDDVSRRDCSFLRLVKKFVFVSQDTWRRFGCRVGKGRGTVVYDGLDLPAPEPGDRDRIRREFGIPEGAPVVGMMARVHPQKDFDTLANAAVRILASMPEARFLIVGDYESAATYREHYNWVQQALAERGVKDSFIFAGHRQDALSFFPSFDVFVLSTHSEGLPLVILEAMAHGLPVVATAVDGIPEVVQHEETGLVHAHADDQELAAHILRFLRDRNLAQQIGSAGRTLVQTRFSTPEFGKNLNDLYTHVLGMAQ
jgi:glycosyltransferase involved in cell wall biosynthesis